MMGVHTIQAKLVAFTLTGIGASMAGVFTLSSCGAACLQSAIH